MAAATISIVPFLNNVNQFIINPIIVFLFALALLIFFFGIFQFINSASEASKREEGKKKIMWGLIGMFIMFSAYGLIRIVLSTFGLSGSGYIN